MSRMIFVNLPVTDLQRSRAFHEALGAATSRSSPTTPRRDGAQRQHPCHAPDPSTFMQVHAAADRGCEAQQSGVAVPFVGQPRRSTRPSDALQRPAAQLIPRRRQDDGGMYGRTSRIPTATSGRPCGWTRRCRRRAPTGRGSHRRTAISKGCEDTCRSIPTPTSRSPPFAGCPNLPQGSSRDLRVRWALEEAGLDYRVRLIGSSARPNI